MEDDQLEEELRNIIQQLRTKISEIGPMKLRHFLDCQATSMYIMIDNFKDHWED